MREPASSAEQPEELWTLGQQASRPASGQPSAAQPELVGPGADQSKWIPVPASEPAAGRVEVQPEDMEPPLSATETSRLGSLLPETTTRRA